MQTESFKVVGIDVSKSSVTCCILSQYPRGGLVSYWKKSSLNKKENYPSFFSNPKQKSHQKSAFDFIEWLDIEKPSLAVLEPTGNHYSHLWSAILEKQGIKILWIGHAELRRYRAGKNLPNKSDEADALAMAAYALDQENSSESGEIDISKFIRHRPNNIDELRELIQQLEHLNRVQSPIINYARQLMSWQFPEKAHSESETLKDGFVAPLWGWIAGRNLEIDSRQKKTLDNKYSKSIATELGFTISDFLKSHADMLCDIDVRQRLLRKKIEELIDAPEFSRYNKIFEQFSFSSIIRARLLSRCYPFESFLLPNGKQWIEREVREVKRKEVTRSNGKRVIKFSPGDSKRVKRNRSRDCFKLRLGMGTILEQSGDELHEKPSGSSLCRINFFQHVRTKIEPRMGERLTQTDVNQEILKYYAVLDSMVDASGNKLLSGKHIEGKLMSKVANLLYRELAAEFTKMK